MKKHTIFIARLFGMYLLLIAAWMFLKKPVAITTITEMLADRPLMLFIAIFATLGGLAMVLGHNIWSGGVLPVLVTLIGWILLVRSLLLLFVPPEETQHVLDVIQFEHYFYAYMGIPLVMGGALAFLGFTARAKT